MEGRYEHMAARNFNWGTALFGVVVVVALAVYGYSALNEMGGNKPSEVPPQESPAASASDLIVSEQPKPVPDTVFTDADGGSHKLTDFRGRYTLVNFWATWCGPCKVELPALQALKETMGNTLQVVTISVDKSADVAAKYLADNGVAGLDTYTDPSLDISIALGANELPTTVLIDPSGNVIGRHTGGAEWDSPSAVATLKGLIGKS